MQEIQLSIPGKTFVAGEYLALKGLTSLVLTSSPEFVGVWNSNKNTPVSFFAKCPFASLSPAGQLYAQFESELNQWNLKWLNPYKVGGFGASTAEFIAIYSLLVQLGLKQDCLKKLLEDYRILAKDPKSQWSPSGADLLAQYYSTSLSVDGNKPKGNSLKFIDTSSGAWLRVSNKPENASVEELRWPFENLGVILISTGVKLPTHEHLLALKEFNSDSLEQVKEQIFKAFVTSDEQLFLRSVKELASELLGLGFVAPHARTAFQSLNTLNGVAAKGCGALGSDVLFVCYDLKLHDENFENLILNKLNGCNDNSIVQPTPNWQVIFRGGKIVKK